jgi:ribosomal protein L11 methyltransferase
MHLHRRARATASDIDPVSVAVARANARLNAVPLGRGPGALHLVAAPGLAHPELAARAPYDLVLANILAGPLVGLAPGLARAVAPGGTLILAGLLRSQARRVLAAYTARGLRRSGPVPHTEWPVLVLTRPGHHAGGISRGVRETAGRRPTASAW